MEKYKINFGRKKLTEQEIGQGADFEKFAKGYKPSTPWYASTAGKIGAFAGAALVSSVIVYNVYNKNAETEVNNKIPFVSPSVAGLAIEYKEYKINPTKDTVVAFKTGSYIEIPANAFMDKNGIVAVSDVNLRYREFHDPVDFFVSGIPMQYDSAGKQYTFESAGMFDIVAFDKNGEQLYANPDSKINVNLASGNSDDKFNVYYLDTANKKWDYISRQKAEPMSANTAKRIVKNVQITKTEVIPPSAPQKATSGLFNIAIEYNKEQFPKLEAYDGVKWEVLKKNKDFKPEYTKMEWLSVNVEKSKDDKEYLLTFISEKEKKVFVVQPVLEGVDYTKAKQEYDKKMLIYNNLKSNKSKSETEAQQKMDSAYKTQNEAVLIDELNRKAALANLSGESALDKVSYRAFEISRFGVWNSDCPSSLPTGQEIFVKFQDKKKNDLTFNKIYLVEKGKNAVYTYYSNDFSSFKFNPKADNLVWAVTADNRPAIFSAEDFKKAVSVKNDTITFQMEIVQQAIKKPEQLKMLLKI